MELRELAVRLGGRSVEGAAGFDVRDVAGLEDGGPGDLGFVRSVRAGAALADSRIGALIAPSDVEVGGRPVIRSQTPNLDFARATGWIRPGTTPPAGIHPAAFVSPEARVDPSASVGPQAVVGAGSKIGPGTVLHANASVMENVEIGADCCIYPGVVVREGCRIGDRVRLQPGVVIGGDGFGYEFNERGEHEKVPQVGDVVIEDDVEIGANSTVDRARLGTTRIGRGTKIDNLVQVGHNAEIGAHCVLISQAGVAGSARLGDRVFVMAQAGVGGHVSVGDGSFVGARGGVIEDTEPGSRVWGFPALPERAWHRAQALMVRLPELLRRLRDVERRLEPPDPTSTSGPDTDPNPAPDSESKG